jgi:hypothetical protein
LLTSVTDSVPAPESHSAAVSTDITATLDQAIDPESATPDTFVVHSLRHGQLIGAAATMTANGSTVTLDPSTDLFPNELVQVTATAGLQSTSGQSATPHTWQFRAAATSGNADFVGVEQNLGDHRSRNISLGDLDGDLDAFVGNRFEGNRIWLNQDGQFTDSGQVMGNHDSYGVALGSAGRRRRLKRSLRCFGPGARGTRRGRRDDQGAAHRLNEIPKNPRTQEL